MAESQNLDEKESAAKSSSEDSRATSRLLQPHLLTGYHHRGYLPHFKIAGGTYWVTFHLDDSLPQHVLQKLEEERKDFEKCQQKAHGIDSKELARQWQRLYSKRVQSYLDAGFGACWLQRDDIGHFVASAIRHFEDSRYDLHPWVVMPNHVHVNVTPREPWTLSSILHSWKSYTGTQANRILGREGKPFWRREAYDHLVRNEQEFYRICEYTMNNPVTAGLCSRPEDWKFSSAYVPQASSLQK